MSGHKGARNGESSNAHRLFDRLLMLEPGQKIIIPFNTIGEMKSKKVILMRERKKYETAVGPELKKKIYISQEQNVKEGVFKLHLTTDNDSVNWLEEAVLVDKTTGDAKPLGVMPSAVGDSSEEERIKKLKEEAGEV